MVIAQQFFHLVLQASLPQPMFDRSDGAASTKKTHGLPLDEDMALHEEVTR